MLTDERTTIAGILDDAGLRSAEYVGVTLAPPCAAVVPHQPYVRAGTPTDRVPFGHFIVGIDVLLLASREASKTAAASIDQQIETALAALADYDIAQVSQPGVVTLNGAKFIGAVINLEITTRSL